MTARGEITIVAALVLALGASNLAWWLALARVDARRADAEAKAAQCHGDIQRQRAEFESEARQQEREQHAALQGIRTIVEQELTDAETKHQRVVAALRADNLRLRAHWQGCAAPGVPASAAAAAGVDAAAALRDDGAGNLVRAAAECDARIRGLQAYARLCSNGGAP